MITTPVFDTYWRFTAARQGLYYERLRGPVTSSDPILLWNRFTNVFRASDRVSQFLIREVIGGECGPYLDVAYRVLLFKFFNKIGTWRVLVDALGSRPTIHEHRHVVEAMRAVAGLGQPLYGGAYMIPCPPMGLPTKWECHLELLRQMFFGSLDFVMRYAEARSLGDLYAALRGAPGIGDFLAYQFAVDLNYAREFDEDGFVVPGPGALDGISKCFSDLGWLHPAQIVAWTVAVQESTCDRLGLPRPSLFGRRMHLIDAQNVYCEISKYARKAHPEVAGISGRTRLKQRYRPDPQPMPMPQFPPSWGINEAARRWFVAGAPLVC